MPDYEHEQPSEADFMQVLREYFPDKKDIRGKGNLHPNLTILFPAAKLYPRMYSTVGVNEETVKLSDKLVDDIENRLISVRAESRKEYRDILTSWLRQFVGDTKKGILGYFGPGEGEK